MSNFWQRALTGIMYVVVLLGMTLLHPLSLGILFLVMVLLASNEFYNIALKRGNTPQKLTGIFISAVGFLLSFLCAFYQLPLKYLLTTILLLSFLFITELYRKKNNPFRQIAFTLTGIIWVGLPLSLIPFLVSIPGEFHPEILVGCFYLVWANDTGAYLFGIKFGKRRLFERISPKKSWEGAAGGALLAIIVSFIIARFYTVLLPEQWLIIALITILAGNYGDLVESLYKRSKNIKDSGTILPGHGGILDRIDSLLMVIPFVFVYLILAEG